MYKKRTNLANYTDPSGFHNLPKRQPRVTAAGGVGGGEGGKNYRMGSSKITDKGGRQS